ncbi:hypothetical protein L218DRAFT_174238 [Marasmius fiardii PR-910]|nr:hypothetical protein L218DRAFT_174238 [Marasmius fiardii PR-910]
MLSALRDLRFVHFKYSVFLAMCSNTLTDFLVAAALIYTIVISRPSLGWTTSSHTMLIAYAMNTGTITGIASLIVLIAFIIGGVTEPLYIVSEMVLPQLYINCFLSMINASFYFQTKSSLDIAISYRSRRLSNSHVLNLSRMPGNHNDPERLMHHRNSSGSSEGDCGFGNLTLVKSPGTINEVGLPLFERNGDKIPEVPRKKLPVEIQIETTKTEYSIDRRMLHDTGYQTARIETGNHPTS